MKTLTQLELCSHLNTMVFELLPQGESGYTFVLSNKTILSWHEISDEYERGITAQTYNPEPKEAIVGGLKKLLDSTLEQALSKADASNLLSKKAIDRIIFELESTNRSSPHEWEPEFWKSAA